MSVREVYTDVTHSCGCKVRYYSGIFPIKELLKWKLADYNKHQRRAEDEAGVVHIGNYSYCKECFSKK